MRFGVGRCLLLAVFIYSIFVVFLIFSAKNNLSNEDVKNQIQFLKGQFHIQKLNTEGEKEIKTERGGMVGFDLEYFLLLANITFPKDGDPRFSGFDEAMSHSIPLDRIGHDFRSELCQVKSWIFKPDMNVSFVIIFKDEPWSTLLRTVVSILIKSPLKYIQEIILVDDQSTRDYLKEPLERFISPFNNIKLVRTPFQMGVARSRNFGARHTQGSVIIFLDSHCEVSVEWLEPLLEAISDDPTRIAIPSINHISSDNLVIRRADPNVHNVFNWRLGASLSYFRQSLLDNYKMTDAIPQVSIMGQVIAVDRDYFFRIGTFAEYLEGWGGEDTELSIRSWLCGGGVVKCRCSQFVHVFKKRPYNVTNNPQVNVGLMAAAWLDVFLPIHKCTTRTVPSVDTSVLKSTMVLKDKLNCKGFGWFRENIFPELEIPEPNTTHLDPSTSDYPNFLRVDVRDNRTLIIFTTTPSYCSIALVNNKLKCKGKCLTVVKDTVTLEPCDVIENKSQLWKYENQEIRTFYKEDFCLAIGYFGRGVITHCDAKSTIFIFHTEFKPNCLK